MTASARDAARRASLTVLRKLPGRVLSEEARTCPKISNRVIEILLLSSAAASCRAPLCLSSQRVAPPRKNT